MNRPNRSLLAAPLLLVLGFAPIAGSASQNDPERQTTESEADAIAARIRTLEAQPDSATRSDALQAVADDAGRSAASAPSGSAVWRRLQSDRLYALGLARRDGAALAVFETMVAAGVEVPDYAVPVLAAALGRQGRVAEADVLLQRLALARPTDPDPVIRRAYVLNDAGRTAEARAVLMDWLDGADTGLRAGEADRFAAGLALVRLDRWTGAHARAAARLQGLGDAHHDDPAWKAEAAALARARGRPRAALAALAGTDPAVAADTRAQAWLDLGRPDRARPFLADAADPDLQHRTEALAASRGHLATRYGNSRSAALASPNGANEVAVSASVDSALLGSGWRLGTTVARHRADFRGSRPEAAYAGVRVVRPGTGGESSLEVGRSFDQFLPGTYAVARADYWVADDLRLAGRVAVNDPDSSLQARASGIGSNALDVAATWRPDMRFRIDAGAGVVCFDDGNRRDWASLSGERRLHARAGSTTSAFAGLYASRSTLEDAAYFNPRRDGSLELGLVHGFRGGARTWHSLRPSVSIYQQQGWHAFVIPRLSYSLRYPTGPGRWLQAGLSFARPVYDGTRETHWALTLEYAWGQP